MSLQNFIFILALFLALPASAATSSRRIFLYQQQNSVSYSGEVGQSSCRMSLKETESAELLEETKDYIKVRFPKGRMQGCFGDTLFGRDIDVGWIPRKEVTYGDDDPSPVQLIKPKSESETAAPCPPARSAPVNEPAGLRDIANAIRAQAAGIKSVESFDKYRACYPLTSAGEANYAACSPVMDKIASTMGFRKNGVDYAVNPMLFRCLIWRESQYDPSNKSETGAMGLGQHTNVNILHIKNRLQNKNNWERQVWDQTYAQMKSDPYGAALLKRCPRTANGAAPTFVDKEDAKCPLNSLIASAIYNLQIQESLMRSAKLKNIRREDELNFQVAVGATYNLGDGVAAKAVSDLTVDNWPSAIQKRAQNPGKSVEVANHITALRNCMEDKNAAPMAARDAKSRRCEYPNPPAAAASKKPLPAPKASAK